MMKHFPNDRGDGVPNGGISTVAPWQTQFQNVANKSIRAVVDEFMGMRKAGKGTVDGLFTESNRRLKERVTETQHQRNESSERNFYPGLGTDMNVCLMMQQAKPGPARMQQCQPCRVLEELKHTSTV